MHAYQWQQHGQSWCGLDRVLYMDRSGGRRELQDWVGTLGIRSRTCGRNDEDILKLLDMSGGACDYRPVCL